MPMIVFANSKPILEYPKSPIKKVFLSDTKMRIGIIAIVLTTIISIIMVCNLLDFDMYVKGIFCVAILWLTGFFVILLHNYYLEVIFRNKTNDIPNEHKSFWYSINPDGVLGICLDDEWKFVLSRMLHLKMITHEEFMNYHNECFDLETDFGNSCVSYQIEAKLDIINLKKISFFIDEGKLNNIFIEIKDSTGIGDLLIKSNGKPNKKS